MADGTATASEWPIHLSGSIPGPQQMAANFALFYDFAVLIIDNDSVGRLDAGQDEILRQTAATTLQRSIDERVRDAAAFRDAARKAATSPPHRALRESCKRFVGMR